MVDWLKEIRFPVGDDGKINPDDLMFVLNEATGGANDFKMILKYYSNSVLSLYHLCENGCYSINNVLSWHGRDLKLRIFSGDIERLNEEADNIKEEIVVDALSLLMLAKLDLLFLLNIFNIIHITSSNVEKLQYEYLDGLSKDHKSCTYKAYKLLESSKKFKIHPDFPEMTKKANDYYIPKYLYDAVSFSISHEIGFLYADEVILHFMKPVFLEDVTCISIPALLRNHQSHEDARMHRFRLLKDNYHFINFDYLDMYHQLSVNDYDFSKTDIKPFFQCKSSHDMNSYGRVYYTLLACLIEENHSNCAIDFAKYVLQFLDKTTKRSRYHMLQPENYRISPYDEYRYQTMMDFVVLTLTYFMCILYRSGEPYSSLVNDYKFEYIPKHAIDDAKECAREYVGI